MNELFPDRLRRLRVKAGWSQKALSETIFGTRERIGQWEGGGSMPRAADLPRIAAILGCSIDYLLTGQESPHSAIHRAIRMRADV